MYVTLTSNSSTKYFPQNNPGKFVVQLPHPLTLTGEWEVALTEIQFTNSYYNVQGGDYWIKGEYMSSDLPSNRAPPTHRKFSIVIPDGLYRSNMDFINELNKQCSEILMRGNRAPLIKFFYNFTTKRVSVKINANLKMNMSPLLAYVIGFKDTFLENGSQNDDNDDKADIDNGMENNRPYSIIRAGSTKAGPTTFKASSMMDIRKDTNALFIYCDVVASRHVGDTLAPLLRVIPLLESSDKPMEYMIFNKLQYLPLSRNQISTIEIHLSSQLGQQLSFTSGYTFVTLHFRRQRLEY